MIKYPIYVTLDTNILDSANYDFDEKSTLQLLANYVKKGKVKVVLSNIVVKEAEKHIVQRGVKVYSLMRKIRAEALKTAADYQIKQLGLGHILDLSTPSEATIIAADICTKAASIKLGFVDRFSGSVIIVGSTANVESALNSVITTFYNKLGFDTVAITKT